MENKQNLSRKIYTTSRKMCREVATHLDIEFENDAVDLIAELVWKKLQIYAIDLEAFAKHAKRTKITPDDVTLLVRHNDSLKQLLDSKLKFIQSSKPPESNTGGKRKRKDTVS